MINFWPIILNNSLLILSLKLSLGLLVEDSFLFNIIKSNSFINE